MGDAFFHVHEWFLDVFKATQRTGLTKWLVFVFECAVLAPVGGLHFWAHHDNPDRSFRTSLFITTLAGVLGALAFLFGAAMLWASFETDFSWTRYHPGLFIAMGGGYVFLRACGMSSKFKKED